MVPRGSRENAESRCFLHWVMFSSQHLAATRILVQNTKMSIVFSLTQNSHRSDCPHSSIWFVAFLNHWINAQLKLFLLLLF
jgi:hypothetical protein